MEEGKNVVAANALIGRGVVSLTSGNRLGVVRHLFIDPLNGVLFGIRLAVPDGSLADLRFDGIHSFGKDAIMAASDDWLHIPDDDIFSGKPSTRELIGTQIITDSGNALGQIVEIHVDLTPPQPIIYQTRETFLDKILGRERFIPAAAGYALSDDRQRLIVPNETADIAASSIEALTELGVQVRSIPMSATDDDTVIVFPVDDEETVVREREDETVVRRRDEDETVVRFPRRAGS